MWERKKQMNLHRLQGVRGSCERDTGASGIRDISGEEGSLEMGWDMCCYGLHVEYPPIIISFYYLGLLLGLGFFSPFIFKIFVGI